MIVQFFVSFLTRLTLIFITYLLNLPYMNPKNNYSPLYFSAHLPLHEKVNKLIQSTKRLMVLSSLNKNNGSSEIKNPITGIKFTKPSLLLSRCELNNNQQFSYLLVNPTKSYCKGSSFFNNDFFNNKIVNDQLKTDEKRPKRIQHIPLHSGWVGYYSYPNHFNSSPLPSDATDIAEFHYYPYAICLDHTTGDFHLLGNPDTHAKNIFELLQQEILGDVENKEAKNGKSDIHCNKMEPLKHSNLTTQIDFKASKFTPTWSKEEYKHAFYKIQDYLKAGDCYQVNLTQPHKAQYVGSAIETLAPLYSALNPSYGCYFEGSECTLVSVSPERFMSIDDEGRLEAKPIKGTIKRSEDPIQDQLYIDELKNSTKDQAENLMIVDLLRNDLSMSAEPNSVKVEKLFDLETHPNVHHLVSTISAQLKSNLTPSEAIQNAFPGGSITGAPKKRAMEIINELEAQPRSLYCGSFGYYSDTGHVDFNILIRSLEFRKQEITCWGGGGITISSDCDEEYEESLTKVRKIMEVIEGL